MHGVVVLLDLRGLHSTTLQLVVYYKVMQSTLSTKQYKNAQIADKIRHRHHNLGKPIDDTSNKLYFVLCFKLWLSQSTNFNIYGDGESA